MKSAKSARTAPVSLRQGVNPSVRPGAHQQAKPNQPVPSVSNGRHGYPQQAYPSSHQYPAGAPGMHNQSPPPYSAVAGYPAGYSNPNPPPGYGAQAGYGPQPGMGQPGYPPQQQQPGVEATYPNSNQAAQQNQTDNL